MIPMSKIYIEKLDEKAFTGWGLFYEDNKGVQHLTEDFKTVVFETEEMAKAFTESQKWKYASTYAKTARIPKTGQ